MDPYYRIQWDDDTKEDEKEWVDGFAVPYRFRFLLPIINIAHYSALWTKYRIQYYGAMIPRKVFLFYPNHLREDYTDEVIFFDDEEQYTYTSKLQKEDILRNEGYAKVFSFLVITPAPLFFTRLYIRFTFLDALSVISIIISAWGIPAVRTDSLAVILPGQWKLFFLRINIYIAAVIVLHVIFCPLGRVTWDLSGTEILWMNDVKHFGILPLIMALISHCARRFMEAVNMVELEHIRYSYLPHIRGGIKDVPELPQDPPGPPPLLPASEALQQPPKPPVQPARPPPPPVLPETRQRASPWTADEYGFSFDQWVSAVFVSAFEDSSGIRQIPSPPVVPPKPMSQKVRKTYYLACYQWQRDHWPNLLRQPPLPQERSLLLGSAEVNTQFLERWAHFQMEEWRSFQRQRGRLQTPTLSEIPPPPPLPQNPTRDICFAYYFALGSWRRDHWKDSERQRAQFPIPAQLRPDSKMIGDILQQWAQWQRDTWDDLRRGRINIKVVQKALETGFTSSPFSTPMQI